MRVLVVVSEASLLRILERGLHAHGFDVIGVESSRTAIVAAGDPLVRCVVIDWSDGDQRADALRTALATFRPDLPIIFLTTGDQPDESPDDRLTKPFALEELIGRIWARARSADEPRVGVLVQGDLRLDLMARCAWRQDQAIELPSREFALLEYFMRHAGRVLSRRNILADVWGYEFDASADSNVVDVYVGYVRRRITRPGEPPLIATVRGEGYRFDAPSSEPPSPPSTIAVTLRSTSTPRIAAHQRGPR